MIKQAISRVVEGQNLGEADMIEVMSEIMRGEATPAQIAAFVVGLRVKGETVEEITGAARVMREYATPVRVGMLSTGREGQAIPVGQEAGALLDTCGTGGSGIRSFNISTTVAFVVAACGVRVAKHGNRSVSSACGSADVLEALGVRLDAGVDTVERCIAEAGIGFLFAPSLHGAMRHAIGPRREIGIRTIFNILGPLTNPAGADRQLLGVYREDLVPTLADVLCRLGCRRGFVVCGQDGMDEVTLTAPTRLADIRNGEFRLATVTPEDFDLRRCSLEDLAGGDARFNARLVQAVLKGETGPRRDIVLLNSAFALVAGGVVSTVDDGLTAAATAVDEGRAMEKLQALIRITGS